MKQDLIEEPIQITLNELAFIVASCIFVGQQCPFTDLKELADQYIAGWKK